MEDPTTLYRAFDATGRLLYVGIARSWPQRWAQHAKASAFFDDVTRIELERLDTRYDAEVAERRAIAREQPLHNILAPSKPPRVPRRRFHRGLSDHERAVIAAHLDRIATDQAPRSVDGRPT